MVPTTSILLFPVVGRCRSLPESVSSSWAWSKTPVWRWKCHPIYEFPRDKYFRFWWPQCHFRLSVIVAITWQHFTRLAMVENPELSVGISTLSVVVPVVPVLVAISLFPVVVRDYNHLLTLFASSLWSKTPGLPSEW